MNATSTLGTDVVRAEHAANAPLRTGAILAIILLSYFMILLDNSVIFTALPSLEAELGLSRGELSWVQDAYTLVCGGLLLLGARAGDILGRRRVFIAGQGLVFAPLTAAGIAGVSTRDAGAASGLVNTFHQLGMSLGLGILVAVSAGVGSPMAGAPDAAAATRLTEQVFAALTAGSVLLALCLVISVVVLPAERARARQTEPKPAAAGEGVPA